MPFRTKTTVSAPGVGTRSTRPQKVKRSTPPKVSVPYAPTKTGKAAERKARGRTTVPYAPTPTGKAAERRGKLRKVKRIERAALKTLRHAPPSPAAAVTGAAQGVKPPQSPKWRKAFPEAAKAADKAYVEHIAKRENLGEPEDITHAIEAATFAAGGVGLAKAALKGGEEIAASAAEKGASKATESAIKRIVAGVKGAPKAALKDVKSTPEKLAAKAERVRTAPARAVKTAKRAPELATKEGQQAAAKASARSAARHPVRTSYGAAAASPVPLPGELDKRARAFAQGTWDATTGHPGKVAETTAQGALGAFAVPWDVGKAAANSAVQGSTEPLTSTVSGLGDAAAKMASNLASGNPQKVERTTLTETGLTPFIPAGALGKLARDSRVADSIRSGIRDTVEGHRAATRDSRIAAERQAKEQGLHVAKKRVKPWRRRALHEKPIHLSVPDTTRGGNYALRRTGAFIEKQKGRHYIARTVDRIARKGQVWGDRAARPIVRELRKSKLVNHDPVNAADALSVVVDHGISRDPKIGLPQAEEIKRSFPAPKADDPADVVMARHSVDWIIEHPQIFHDSHFWNAVDHFKRQAEEVGYSPRKRWLASNINVVNPRLLREGKLPILKPEERVTPETAAILRKAVPSRAARWSRGEALSYAQDLSKVKGPERAQALATRDKLLASFKLPDGSELMKPPEFGGAEHGVSTTHATSYTPEMRDAFAKEMTAAHKEFGYETPAAYVAHKLPSKLGPEDIVSGTRGDTTLRKSWPEQGKAVASGNTESGFESLLRHSVYGPRSRTSLSQGLDEIFNRATRRVRGKRLLTRSGVESAINSHEVPAGTLFLRPQMLKRAIVENGGKDPAQLVEEEIERGQRIGSESGKSLHDTLVEAEQSGMKGEKFAPMNSAEIHELMRHTQRITGPLKGVRLATNGASRAILNSPGFLAIRFAHEIPAALALGKAVVDVPRALAAMRKIAKIDDPETRAELSSVFGTSPGLRGDPAIHALRATAIHDPIRAAATPRVWTRFWNVINGDVGGRFDRARTALARETIGTSKLLHDLGIARKGFPKWRTSANNVFKGMQDLVEKTRGMSDHEAIAYIAKHPEMGDRLAQDMTRNMGNFTSLTAFEKHVAPLTLFYSFQRYTVMWTLYHFPLDHPVVATALNWLGQANGRMLRETTHAEQAQLRAEEKAKGKPLTPFSEPSLLDYGYGVVKNGPKPDEAEVLPGALRANPLLGGIQRAVGAGKPSQLIGEAAPEFQIPITNLLGVSSYTGEAIKGNRLVNILAEVASLSPALRYAGLSAVGGEVKALGHRLHWPGAQSIEGKEPSGLSQAYKATDPLRGRRSVLDPFLGQTIRQFAKEEGLGSAVGGKWGKGHIPGPFDAAIVQELLYGGPHGGPKPKMLPRVLKAIHDSERASDYLKTQEEPFYPNEKPFSGTQKELLEAVENAYQTGPSGKATKGLPDLSSPLSGSGLPDLSKPLGGQGLPSLGP